MTSSSTSRINVDLLVGSKLKAIHSASFREHVSAPTSEFAKEQLKRMGWSEGTGLGKKRDGITTHIKVKKRKEQLGLGGSDRPEIVTDTPDEWWKDSLGATLAKLGNKKSKKKKDKKKHKKERKEKSSHKKFTDEELFAATGGKRFGMRAGITNNLHKWVRTEASAASATEEASSSSSSSEEPGSSVLENGLPTSETSVAKAANSSSKKRKLEESEVVKAESDKKKSKKEKKEKKKRERKLKKNDQDEGNRTQEKCYRATKVAEEQISTVHDKGDDVHFISSDTSGDKNGISTKEKKRKEKKTKKSKKKSN